MSHVETLVTRKGVAVPAELAQALQGDPQSLAAFEALRPSCQREYATWVEEAKRPETRAKRVARVLEMTLDWKHRRPAKPEATSFRSPKLAQIAMPK